MRVVDITRKTGVETSNRADIKGGALNLFEIKNMDMPADKGKMRNIRWSMNSHLPNSFIIRLIYEGIRGGKVASMYDHTFLISPLQFIEKLYGLRGSLMICLAILI
jgi:hypothetical protein